MRTIKFQPRWGVLLAALTIVSFPTYAVDGIVLINQSSALAGNVTPGDSPGFPVTISVAGSYRLSGNLTAPDANTTAISITADNVILDLNGFSIIGPTLCGGPPISCSPTGSGIGITTASSRLTILNGNIHGMGAAGIQLFGAFYQIEKIHASSNGGTGISAGLANIYSSMAEFNGSDGISASSGEIRNSVSVENAGNGFVLTTQGIAVDNQADHNGASGILGPELPFGKGSIFRGNTLTFNGSAGVSASCPSLIAGNSAFGNTGGNVVTAGSGCVLTGNNPAL